MDPVKLADSPVEHDWDADDFEIPSLKADKQGFKREEVNGVTKGTFRKGTETENIYLGPHGAPPQVKKQEVNSKGQKDRRKQKFKETDRKVILAGRENKADVLRDFMGGSPGKQGQCSKP